MTKKTICSYSYCSKEITGKGEPQGYCSYDCLNDEATDDALALILGLNW